MAYNPIAMQLEPRSIAACKEPPSALHFLKNALQHQVDVFEAAKDHDIILDLAPTGTGKTKAGLTVLLHQPTKNAVYIAPTNALIEQQTKAAEEFVKDAGLPHIVKAVSAKEVRTWSNDRVGARPGEKLYNLLRNPATIFPGVGENRPLLLVTNPDIFYYATFFSYHRLDKINVATSFYTQFSTIIFDEFHLYDAKQLVGLLFYLAYLSIFGFFEAGRRVVLLTATPEPDCEKALAVLESRGVRIKQINGELGSRQVPSQSTVHLEIRPQLERDALLAELVKDVTKRLETYPDQNGAVILDSKVQINDLAKLLQAQGLAERIGRLHGSTPQLERLQSAQRQVILATSTVDVGFNFERHPAPSRQNLDWLIFSTRDRAAFWQRIGRVGRVLGKQKTEIPSYAIAYLSERAWDEGLATLSATDGRDALKDKLQELKALERPFLRAYWQSEAFLEAARPMLMLEELLETLPQADLVPKLFETLKATLGGNRDWKYYQQRMRALQAAQSITTAPDQDTAEDPLKFVKGQSKWAITAAFLKSESPEDWELLKTKQIPLSRFEQLFREDAEVATQLKHFASVFSASYAPLFQFRSNLFESLCIRDPKGFLLDLSEETQLDPIHLLRNYEFVCDGDEIVIVERARETYELSFHLRYYGSSEAFTRTQLNKLTAFQSCQIRRQLKGSTVPTPLLKELEKSWLPGVVVSEMANQGAVFRLRKQGIESYLISVTCDDAKKNYKIFPGLAGIMTAAMNGVKIRLVDEEEFWIA
ncbi:type I-D CRISPR-associated helicase Cas3' [Leptolyngbya sp. FACHB-321]|uniref:type I-D CRISPR-associated helicase Cas3' n=1 Tax=Leptolyngbya sp. FACHB-321 TaxID=2692807 RepID=UPI0016859075|nr:type I-D CRISPR-associated helicase Cas3' [Leptolyngbya sp. FACHB-321]MBD2038302.1 type I-D CRISPR-associated helicase Cas3' [Leptolyngbya sp. FACHB-321]